MVIDYNNYVGTGRIKRMKKEIIILISIVIKIFIN